MMRPGVDQKIQEAFESLDGLTRAEPLPFFYTRLEARLNRRAGWWERTAAMLGRPAIALATAVAVILLNTPVIISAAAPATDRSESAEMAFLDEYNRSTGFYDLENNQP